MFSFVMKKLYGKFNCKLFPLISYFGCYFVFIYLLLIKEKNQIVLAPTTAIGDILYILSFLQSMDKWTKENDKKILFYISDRYKNLVETYEKPGNRIRIAYLKHCGPAHLFLLMIGGCKEHPLLNKFARKCGIIMPIPNAYKKRLGQNIKPKGTRQQLSLILGVPLYPISLHNLPPIPIKNITDFEQNKRRICILNPYSYSMYTFLPLFEKIAEDLKKQNFLIYTNVVNSQEVIKGTLPLECSLQELYSIAKEIPLFVSLRSGILDFLVPSNINMFVVYNKWKVSFVQDDDYSIKEWIPKGKLCEISIKTKSEEEILKEFHSFLLEIKKEN